MTSNEQSSLEQEYEDIDPQDYKKSGIGGSVEKPNLNKKEVVIADIKITAKKEIKKTMKNAKPYRDVIFTLYYADDEGKVLSHENFGGFRQYQDEATEEWGAPILGVPDGKSKAAVLARLWAENAGLDQECFLRSSIADLVEGLKLRRVRLKHIEFDMPSGDHYEKNVIDKFID